MVASISVLSNLKVLGALVLDGNAVDFPVNPTIGTMAIKNESLYAFIKVAGIPVWYPIVKAPSSYVHTQGLPSLTWTINHGLNTTNLWYQIQDADGQSVSPASYVSVDENSFIVTFSEAIVGTVVVVGTSAIDVPSMKASLIELGSVVRMDTTGIYINNQPVLTGEMATPTFAGTGEKSIVISSSALASGYGATAVGTDAHALGGNCTVVGWGASSTGAESVALGAGAGTAEDNGTAVGYNSASEAYDGTAIGHGAKAKRQSTTAIGSGAFSNADATTTVGTAARAYGINSIAIGVYSEANGVNSIAIGNGSISTGANTVSVGKPDTLREIVYVSEGLTDTSAINLGQLTNVVVETKNDTATKLAEALVIEDSKIALKLDSSMVGAANGVVPLDGSTKISALYLPSYVDDVLEFANFAAFPAVGEAGKIYISAAANADFRWTGSTYIGIVASPGTTDAVPEGTGNLYFTVSRALNSVLSGLSVLSSVAIAATDSVVGALGKLQAQITALASSLASKASLGANTFTAGQSVNIVDKGTVSTGTTTFSFAASNAQRLQVGGALTIATSGWPAAGTMGEMLIELVNGASSVITWPAIKWVLTDGTNVTVFANNGVTLQAAGTDWVLLWTRDGGSTVYGKIMR